MCLSYRAHRFVCKCVPTLIIFELLLNVSAIPICSPVLFTYLSDSVLAQESPWPDVRTASPHYVCGFTAHHGDPTDHGA